MSDKNKSALFICLGNICRSPIAEAVFIDVISKNNQTDQWTIDSAGIGSWHAGLKPDNRATKVMQKHNLAYNNKARQIKKIDFQTFDYIFGMDNENIADLKSLEPDNSTAKILLLGDFDPQGDRIIEDPYYDKDIAGFEKCYEQCVRSCNGFLKKLQNNEVHKEMVQKPQKTFNLKVLMVCIGNSCRSPMAESVLKKLIQDIKCPKLNWEIDSAALSDYNIEQLPEPRCLLVLQENGLTSDHITRMVQKNDFNYFDYIFGMDPYIINELLRLAPVNSKATIELLAKYDYNHSIIIEDPIFDIGITSFRTAYCKILRSCENFIKVQLEKNSK